MWSKIYLLTFAVLLLPMLFLSYSSWSWLQSVSAPQAVAANYQYFSSFSWSYLWISTIILLIIGNVLLWTTRRAWALWMTFLYFAFFIIVRYFWLEQSFFQYRQDRGLAGDGLSIQPLIGVVLCALAAVIVFFDQYLIKRLLDKMHPEKIGSDVTSPIESDAEDTN
ncbi:MAG TPA: hypothetical protein VF556_15685 [Pyrinomonadaceae bacterium]|jgi:hypothetical protein